MEAALAVLKAIKQALRNLYLKWVACRREGCSTISMYTLEVSVKDIDCARRHAVRGSNAELPAWT
jgi:hypothetical protein